MMKSPRDIADGVWFLRTLMVNVYMVATPTSWVLIDTGLPGYAPAIRDTAARCLGTTLPPAAIVLTHGHFDHVGSLEPLLAEWPVPVFAHRLEAPYLTGRSKYPPPDPLAGGGSMAWMSRLYPRGPIDISDRLELLPEGGTVPYLDGWRWIATPGHSPGHVSLFRDQRPHPHRGGRGDHHEAGVPARRRDAAARDPWAAGLLHADWQTAGDSVGHIAALEPEVLATGHGDPLHGAGMRDALRTLAAHFDEEEVPRIGRYSEAPAITDERGLVRLPPGSAPQARRRGRDCGRPRLDPGGPPPPRDDGGRNGTQPVVSRRVVAL